MFISRLQRLRRMVVFEILVMALLLAQTGGALALSKSVEQNAELIATSIVFVSRKIPANGSIYMAPHETGSMPGVGPYSRFQVSAPGKLMVREANGTLRILVDGSSPTAASLSLIDVNAPDVSYDATKIIFAGLTAGSYNTGPMTNPGAWRIYVINVDGTGLRQVTFSDQDNLDLSQFRGVASNLKKYDDTDPAWLPDGRIVFSSTRWPSHGMYGGSRTSNLHVVNSNGTGLHRITSERNSADRPLVDPLTGKIVYSRWWRNFRVATNGMETISNPTGGYIMKDGLLVAGKGNVFPEVGGFRHLQRNAWHLATINPDGTGLAQWAGTSNTAYSGQLINHAYGGAFAPDGSFYANFFPMTNQTEAAGFGGIRHYQRGPNGYTPVIGITTRDERIQEFVRTNPNSYGVYQGNYAAEPEVLPDGRLIISWTENIAQDYGLYTINADGSGLSLVYDNPGTTELRARVIRSRPIPPIIPDEITQVASLLPPLAEGPYNRDGTFTFDGLNVYFNAPVDTNIMSAMPVGSANTIRFFIDHQRWQQTGSFEELDWPILLQEVPVNPDGSITASSPANVPLFEQTRTIKLGYSVPLMGNSPGSQAAGAAHVAGMNFGRPGEVVRCVGCHAGHSMIPVPENPADAQWTNLAPGALVSVSSLNSSIPNGNGLIDRRVKMPFPPNNNLKYWLSQSGLAATSQWVQLTFQVPITVRTVRLYNIPTVDSPIRVLNSTVRLYDDFAGTHQVASSTSGALSENGTDVAFDDVLAKVVRVEFNSLNGAIAGLGEVEVIGRGEAIADNTFADVPTTHWARDFVESLYAAAITGGCGNGNFCPGDRVTRSQMAVFLLRGMHSSSYSPPAVGGSTGFGDVPTNYWAAAWIKQLAVEGITGGCGSGNYCPEYPVTRSQMAVFLLRSKYGSGYSPPAVGNSTGFGDVPANYWAAAWIKQLAAEGITGGCGNGNYCPETPVSREQMAVFLVRTFDLP